VQARATQHRSTNYRVLLLHEVPRVLAARRILSSATGFTEPGPPNSAIAGQIVGQVDCGVERIRGGHPFPPLARAWKAANYTRGVIRLLPISKRPLPVATAEVLELHQAKLRWRTVSGLKRFSALWRLDTYWTQNHGGRA
jgi:hypothetical protein